MDIPPALAPYAASSLKAFPDGVKHGKRIPNPPEIVKPPQKEKAQRNAKGREKRISFHQRELAFDFFAPSRENYLCSSQSIGGIRKGKAEGNMDGQDGQDSTI